MTYSINNPYIGDPLTVGNIGSAGQVYTTTSTGNINWGNLNGTSTSWATLSTDPNLQGHSLKVRGDADFEGDVTIQGKSISATLTKLEERLAILHPNEKLEEKWENLRELRKQYMELEAEIIEKEKMWGILKK